MLMFFWKIVSSSQSIGENTIQTKCVRFLNTTPGIVMISQPESARTLAKSKESPR